MWWQKNTDHYFGVECKFKRSSDMRLIFDIIFQRKHQQMIKTLINLNKHSSEIYYLNILIIIAIIYHIYIESE